MSRNVQREQVSFVAFFLKWAEFMHWKVPDFHVRICHWLEHRGIEAVLKVFRGGSKSTILAIYQAWRIRSDAQYRLIDRSADDSTAAKLTADTEHVLRMHPYCKGVLPNKVGAKRFSCNGHRDKRNASLTAYGILSNATSSRADEIINDDVEVPNNVTPDKRITLMNRLEEEIHIIVPGGRVLYVGTDHIHNSVYEQKIANGYDSLVIPLFSHYCRHEANQGNNVFSYDFPVQSEDDFYVMIGIGRGARVLEPWEYELTRTARGGHVRLHVIPVEGALVDIAAGNVWPERFTRAEVSRKRKECRTLNAWDSQYRLIAKPVHEVRLDPEKLLIYDDRPEIVPANGAIRMMIGDQQMSGCRACWDCSLGKEDSDDSAFGVMFQAGSGHLYWQVLDVLYGDVYEQCEQIKRRVIEYQLPSIQIKTRGLGGFLPAILRKVFNEAAIQCGITEQVEKENKTSRILNAFEAPLSGRFLHVHRSVYEGGLSDQMQSWIPSKINQPDDLLDVGEGCISSMPVKIGRIVKPQASGPAPERRDWRQYQGSYELQTEF